MSALYAYVLFLAVIMVVGWVLFCRLQGKRIVSGRPWALLTYVCCGAALVVAGMILHMLQNVLPVVVGMPDIYRSAMVLLLVTPVVILLVAVHFLFHARSLSRSLILFNIERDELAPAVWRALKRTQAQATIEHRLGTTQESFILDAGCIVVHGGVRTSRMELFGDSGAMSPIIDATVDELGAGLQSRGEQIVDNRPRLAPA
jgi:hypothetical protein